MTAVVHRSSSIPADLRRGPTAADPPEYLAPAPTGRWANRCQPGRSAARSLVFRRRRLAAAILFVLVTVVVLAGVAAVSRWAAGSVVAGPSGVPAAGALAPGAVPGALAPGAVPGGAGVRAEHVVQPGDTLWSIARRARPDGDVRPLVDRLVAERGGRPLRVGDRVRVP